MKTALYVCLVAALCVAWYSERSRRVSEVRYLETVMDPTSLGDGWHHLKFQFLVHGSAYEWRMLNPQSCEVLRYEHQRPSILEYRHIGKWDHDSGTTCNIGDEKCPVVGDGYAVW